MLDGLREWLYSPRGMDESGCVMSVVALAAGAFIVYASMAETQRTFDRCDHILNTMQVAPSPSETDQFITDYCLCDKLVEKYDSGQRFTSPDEAYQILKQDCKKINK